MKGKLADKIQQLKPKDFEKYHETWKHLERKYARGIMEILEEAKQDFENIRRQTELTVQQRANMMVIWYFENFGTEEVRP